LFEISFTALARQMLPSSAGLTFEEKQDAKESDIERD
jgi:hypothetical protein